MFDLETDGETKRKSNRWAAKRTAKYHPQKQIKKGQSMAVLYTVEL